MNKSLLVTLIVFVATQATLAQVAVTKIAETPVYLRPNANSEIVQYLPKGISIETTKLYGLMEGIMVKSELGYLLVEDLLFSGQKIEAVSVPVKSIEEEYVLSLLQKNPSELTEKEVYYLMLNEMRKDDEARKDLKKLKNAQVFQAVVTGFAIVSTIIVALAQK